MEERVRARIAELKEARAAYLQETQRQLMGFDAAIGELEALRVTEMAQEPRDPELDAVQKDNTG